jgi:hypothetical protein
MNYLIDNIQNNIECQCILENIKCEHIEECPICLDIFKNEEINILSCNHKYHPQCINQWMKEKKNCPKCRRDIVNIPKNLSKDFINSHALIALNVVMSNGNTVAPATITPAPFHSNNGERRFYVNEAYGNPIIR